MKFDVIIVGGSFAGQAAALQLARAKCNVLLIDAKQPRNRFAKAAHGFIGQDGQAPFDIIATAARQLASYPTVQQRNGTAVNAVAIDGGFQVSLAGGHEAIGRYLILAIGVKDTLPALPGLTERWGVSVLSCPYCHGYELGGRPMGVLADTELGLHQAMLVSAWGPTTLFVQGSDPLTESQMAMLAARGVTVERSPVAELLGTSPQLEAVRLADGKLVTLSGLFVAPQTSPASDLPLRLGCLFKNGPTGPFLAVDARQRTSAPGVFAAGDIANPGSSITSAAATGVIAAACAHQTLMFQGNKVDPSVQTDAGRI